MQKIISPDIVMLYYLVENQFIHVPKMIYFPVCVTFLENISNCQSVRVLNCCRECRGVFVTYVEINDKDYADIPFI